MKTGFLLRKPISRNHAQDVWSGYSMNQRRFNSVRNEWDLCSKFSDADFSDCESDDSTYPKGTKFQRSLPHPTSTIPIPSSTSSPGDDIPMSEPGKTDGDECAPEVIEQATSHTIQWTIPVPYRIPSLTIGRTIRASGHRPE